jgi:hypothetical protein
MSFIVMQTVIARLCVDHRFRQSFRRDADEVLTLYDLSDDEVVAVKAIDYHAVDSYADGLVRKRLGTISKWFPLTFAALRKALPPEQRLELMNGYGYGTIRESDDIGGDWVRSESHEFTTYLRSLVARGELQMAYLPDLLDLETTRREMSQDEAVSVSSQEFFLAQRAAPRSELRAQSRPLLGQHASLRQFSCNIVDLIAQIEEAQAFVAPPTAPTWVLFVKKPRRPKITLQTVTRPVQELLSLCNGARTSAEILDDMVSRHATTTISPDDVRGDCRKVLEECYQAGILAYRATEGASITAMLP